MKGLMIFFLFAMLLLDSHINDAAVFVNPEKKVNAAYNKVPKVLAKEKCKLAFRQTFPGYSDDWDLLGGWDQVKIAVVPSISTLPLARGATQCDISQNTFVLSLEYAQWGDVDTLTETMIHEFVHLLRCPEILAACGSQSNCQPSFVVQEERIAYKIGSMCTE